MLDVGYSMFDVGDWEWLHGYMVTWLPLACASLGPRLSLVLRTSLAFGVIDFVSLGSAVIGY